MSTLPEKKGRTMPKGGRKGGSVFPRVNLRDAAGYAQKLVSKTHTSAQPRDVIFAGVVGAKAGTGDVRISALKQYGFLQGDSKAGYSAADLAKKIAAAPAEELPPLYREAILRPVIFKKLFATFHGDVVSKAKLKQRSADLKVHPDETGTCVELYVAGMVTAGLVTVDGDQIKHIAAPGVVAHTVGDHASTEPDASDESVDEAESTDDGYGTAEESDTATGGTNAGDAIGSQHELRRPGPRAVFNVNVTLDSSLDIEKLEKQLQLLKRFGAI